MELDQSEKTDCTCYIVHSERVATAREQAISPELLADVGELYKVFADPTRLRIIAALAVGELCVCDIGAVLNISQSAVSHQLATLRAARLVAFRRDGKIVYYRLADDHVERLLKLGLEHASERVASMAGERE